LEVIITFFTQNYQKQHWKFFAKITFSRFTWGKNFFSWNFC